MLVNRRTYHNTPGTHRQLLALAKETRDLTKREMGKDIRILTAQYGPMATIVLEIEHEDAEAQEKFEKVWYPMLFERELISKWFSMVAEGKSELWVVQD
jgi:hypothetical protein